MRKDEYGLITLDPNELLESLYTGKISSLEDVYTDNTVADQFNQATKLNGDDIILSSYSKPNIPINEFDADNQKVWFMPEKYFELDIENYVIKKCTTELELSRVHLELELFKQHNMLTLLQYLLYLVDTMKQNKIVWGVGRGSSVASYVLFLLGVHKIDSIKYDLDIKEFLK